jgi:hypothetical protein
MGQSFSFITIDLTLISILNVRTIRSPLAFWFSQFFAYVLHLK